MNQEKNEIIKTIGENGEEIFMRLKEIVTVNEQDYALLSVVDDNNFSSDDNDDELILMKINKNDEECTFEIIESDEEFNEIANAIQDDEDYEEEDE